MASSSASSMTAPVGLPGLLTSTALVRVRDRLGDQARGDAEPVLLPGLRHDRAPAGEAHRLREGRPVRGGDHDLVAAVQERVADQVQRLLSAHGDRDLLRLEGHVEVLAVAHGDRRAQLGDARGRRVARPVQAQGGHRRVLDVGRRRLVGLADAEVEDGLARRLQGRGALRHRDRGRDLEAQGPPRQVDRRPVPLHRALRGRLRGVAGGAVAPYFSASRRSTTGGTRSRTRPPSWKTSFTSRDDRYE